MILVGADPVGLAEHPRRHTFQGVHQFRELHGRRVLDQQMDVVVFPVTGDQSSPKVFAHFAEHLFEYGVVFGGEHSTPVLGHEDQVDVHGKHAASPPPVVLRLSHSPSILCPMPKEVPDRSRKRDKASVCHVAKVSLRVTPRQAKTIDTYFHAGTRLYNSALEEALERSRRLREDPDFETAKQMAPGGARKKAFKALEDRYGFSNDSIQAHLNGLRKSFPGIDLYTHEVQEISDQAFEAVARWHYGKGGRPRFKSTGRGLHSMAGKDTNSAIQPVLDPHGRLVGVRWGKNMTLAAADPKAASSRRGREQLQERARIETLIAEGHYRSSRVVRNKIRGLWVYEAQIVFDTPAPLRHPVGEAQVSMDLGPSTVHWVSETGPGHHDTLAPGVVYPAKTIRRLSRQLDRCHRKESPGCFDSKGRHRKNRCGWKQRSAEALNAQTRLAETHRVLAETRKTEHGALANKVLAAGKDVRCEAQDYRSWQKVYSKSDRDMAPGEYVARVRYKAESAGGGLYEYSTRTTALSQTCVCGRKEKKSLALRWHSCECGVEADRDLFSAFLGLHVRPVGGLDRLDIVGARKAYGPRRQDLACKPGVEMAGLAPGKPRVKRRPPSGERSLVRIAKRLGRVPRGSRSDGAARSRPTPAATLEPTGSSPEHGRRHLVGSSTPPGAGSATPMAVRGRSIPEEAA